MGSQDDLPRLLSMAGPAATAVMSAYLIHLLPNEVRMALAAWTLMSVPIGVLFGHCVLSEE